jgi:hypothetical protein
VIRVRRDLRVRRVGVGATVIMHSL